MWIDTSNDVGIGTTSPAVGQGLTIAPPASSTGMPSLFTVMGPAHTGLTGESNDLNLDLSRTVTFSTIPSKQRTIYIQAPTYAFSGTLGTAATIDISGPPAGGTSSATTISNSYGLNVETASVASSGATVNNAYGLSVSAPSGASNNYAAQFAGPVSGAVGNPSGVLPANGSTYPGTVFHMDGVTYPTLDALLNPLPTNASVTVYDDCPGGTETWTYDPFHDSSGNTHHVHLISAPCLITTNVPVMLKSGDNWDMTSGGYVANATATAAKGTVLRMGDRFPTTLPNSDAMASVTASFSGSGGLNWNATHYYWVGLTAENSSGETTLQNGNYAMSSYSAAGQNSGSEQLTVTVPAAAPPIVGYCVYIVQGGTTPGSFPTNTDAVGAGCYSVATPTMEAVANYPLGGNPPPGVNTTQTLLTLGSYSNSTGAIETNTYVRGGMVDCFGGAIGILNNMAQDPPSGIFDTNVENCSGDALIELEGFDGNLGANGSSADHNFGTASNCAIIMGGCTAGISNTPLAGTVSVLTGGTTVTGSMTSFQPSWGGASGTHPDISIGGNLYACGGNPCQVDTVSSGISLTLYNGVTTGVSGVNYAVGYQTPEYPVYGIHDDAVAQLKKIDGFDYGGDTCGTSGMAGSCPTLAAVKLDGVVMSAPVTFAKVSVHDIHAEGLASSTCSSAPTIAAVVEDNGVPATIEGVHSSCQILYGVQIDNPTYASPGAIHLTDIDPYPLTIGASTKRNAIYDLLSNPGFPYKSNPEEAVGEYDIEQPGNFLNPAGNSSFAGGLTLGSTATSSALAAGSSGVVTTYNSIATVGGGVPSEVGTVDLVPTSSASMGTAYAVPASGTGDYEVLFYAKITTPASGTGASSTLGPMTIGWTDPYDSTSPSCTQPTSGLTTNSTTTQINGFCFFRAKQSTNITYSMAYGSTGTTAMKYILDLRVIAH